MPMTIVKTAITVLMCLTSLQPSLCATPPLRQQAREGQVLSIVADRDGCVWIGTSNGLVVCEGDKQSTMPLPSLTHHPFPAIHALALDRVGQRLWIGAWNHLYCYDLTSKRFITLKDSLIHQTVRLEPTDNGRLKAYTQHGLYITTVPDSQATQLNTVTYKKREPLSLEEVARHVDLGRDFTPWLWTIVFFIAIIIAAGIIIIRKRKKALVKISSLEGVKEEQGTATSELSAADSQPTEQSKPANDFIAMATRVVERHLADEAFSIETFAQDMAVSRAQLFRKLKAANGKTPHDFILTVRMEHALRLLRQGAPLAEAAMKTGYSDVSNFRRSFIKAYGMPPAEYLKSTAN